jgi:hypothetical protein
MDEKSGMNFSEYVAILSGNTELLEKARVEKKIASLESERQAFVRGKSSSRFRLDEITKKMEKNTDLIGRITGDLDNFKSRVQLNDDGSYKNPIKLNGIEGGDIQFIGKNLNHIARTARTDGDAHKIGELYGFDILVKSEASMKEGFDFVQNRFYVRGEGEYLYHYNHGNLASDPRLAAQNFINALGTIEPTLEKFRAENEKMAKDIPVLREVIEGTWRKEPELAALKGELTELDRKIQLSLKPIEDSEGEPINELGTEKLQTTVGDNPPSLQGTEDFPQQGNQESLRSNGNARQQDNRQSSQNSNEQQPSPSNGNGSQQDTIQPSQGNSSTSQPYISSRLREIADASGGRIVVAGVGSPPRKQDSPPNKGFKI